MFMLCCTAQGMCHICSWNCQIMLKNVLNWHWGDFCSAHKWSIRLDRLMAANELAALGQSLESVVHCCWTCWLTQSYYCMLNYPLSSHWHMKKPITTPICCHSRSLCSRFARGTHIMLALCSMSDVAYYAQHYAHPIGTALVVKWKESNFMAFTITQERQDTVRW